MKMRSAAVSVAIFGAAAAMVGCQSPSQVADSNQINRTLDTQTGDAEVVVVAMHADWCPACQTLGPTVQEAMAKMTGEPVRLVVADWTDRRSPEGQKTLDQMGLGSLAAANGGKTGIAYVVDAQTGAPIATLDSSDSAADVERTVRQAIVTAS